MRGCVDAQSEARYHRDAPVDQFPSQAPREGDPVFACVTRTHHRDGSVVRHEAALSEEDGWRLMDPTQSDGIVPVQDGA